MAHSQTRYDSPLCARTEVVGFVASSRVLTVESRALTRNVNDTTSAEEKCFIKVLRQEKEWGAKRICSEFWQKKWAVTVSSVNDLLRKIDKTGSVERKVGSGRPRSTRTQRNISRVNDFICSQEDNPGTSESPREIQKVTGISRAFCH